MSDHPLRQGAGDAIASAGLTAMTDARRKILYVDYKRQCSNLRQEDLLIRHFPDGFLVDAATDVDAQITPIGSVEQRNSLSPNDSEPPLPLTFVARMVHDANLQRRCRLQYDDSGRNHTHHPVSGASDAAVRLESWSHPAAVRPRPETFGVLRFQ